MKKFSLVGLMLLLCALHAHSSEMDSAQRTSDVLDGLWKADQSERTMKPAIPYAVIEAHDIERRKIVQQLMVEGKVHAGADFYKAAQIFQHGESVEDARTAYSLAWIAVSVMPESKEARWLSAASWDRLMMRQKKAQWYGTQYVKSDDGKQWVLYEFDENGVSDTERRSYGIDAVHDITRSMPRTPRPDDKK